MNIEVKGWEEFISKIKSKYKNGNIHYRNSSGTHTYALLFEKHSKNLVIGVFNLETETGKVFDRRLTDRD